jgi:hypothetical protein
MWPFQQQCERCDVHMDTTGGLLLQAWLSMQGTYMCIALSAGADIMWFVRQGRQASAQCLLKRIKSVHGVPVGRSPQERVHLHKG